MNHLQRNTSRALFFFVYFQIYAACTAAQKPYDDNCNDAESTIRLSKQYKNDSAFISFTIYKWIDSSYGWFGHYNTRNAPSGYYKVHVGDIYYDSLKSKLTGFVYVEYSTNYIDTNFEKISDTLKSLFDSHTIMGYRDPINKIWRLYALEEIFIGLRSPTLEDAQNFHKNILLNKNEMTKRKVAVYDEKSGLNTRYEAVNYIPCEQYFWTESPLWKKGERVPGYYIFETYMNATPSQKNLRPFCKIDYPDSLLNFYK